MILHEIKTFVSPGSTYHLVCVANNYRPGICFQERLTLTISWSKHCGETSCLSRPVPSLNCPPHPQLSTSRLPPPSAVASLSLQAMIVVPSTWLRPRLVAHGHFMGVVVLGDFADWGVGFLSPSGRFGGRLRLPRRQEVPETIWILFCLCIHPRCLSGGCHGSASAEEDPGDDDDVCGTSGMSPRPRLPQWREEVNRSGRVES